MDDERFEPLTLDQMTAEQRRVAEAILAGPRRGMRGPFKALLRSPELADRFQKIGEYLLFQSALPPRLREIGILLTARHWSAQFEWASHQPLAKQAGVTAEIAAQIQVGDRPTSMQPDEAAVHDFCVALLRTGQVEDAAFDLVKSFVGEQGVIELVGAVGYYTTVAFILNVDRYKVDGEPPLAPVPPPR